MNPRVFKKLAFTLLVLSLLSLPVLAEENLKFPWVYRPLAPHLNTELSPLAEKLYGSEMINVYDLGGAPIGSVGTIGGILNHLNESQWERPTVKVYIGDQKIIYRMLEAEDRKTQLKKEFESGRVRVEPETFGGRIRFFLVKLLAGKL